MKAKLLMFLANRGLPDRGQYPNLPVYGTANDCLVVIEDLDDAERKVHRYISGNCLEKENFIGGQVLLGDEMMGYFNPDGAFYNKFDVQFPMKKQQFEDIMMELQVKEIAKLN